MEIDTDVDRKTRVIDAINRLTSGERLSLQQVAELRQRVDEIIDRADRGGRYPAT